MKKKLSKKKQIAILREAYAQLLSGYRSNKAMGGLCCYLFGNADYIPLFTRENAMQFGNAYSSYESISFWWNRDAEGAAKRIAFLDWMEEGLLK